MNFKMNFNFLLVDGFLGLARHFMPGCFAGKYLNQIPFWQNPLVLAYSKLLFDLFLYYFYHYLIQNGFIMTEENLGLPTTCQFDILNLKCGLNLKHTPNHFCLTPFGQACLPLKYQAINHWIVPQHQVNSAF